MSQPKLNSIIISQVAFMGEGEGKEKEEKKEAVGVSDVENGPVTEANRECRDIFCCLLFLVAIGGMIYLTVYGYTTGNPDAIFRGVDQNGNICGVTTGYQGYPYLYFTNPLFNVAQRTCVSSCPSWTGTAVSTTTCFTSSDCTYGPTVNNDGTPSAAITATDKVGYPTYSVLSRLCVPNPNMFSTVFSTVSSSVSSAFQQGDLGSFISDISNNWQYLLAALGFAVVVGFIFMFLLRCLAGCIVWVSLLGIIFFFIGLGLIFLYNAGKLGDLSSAAKYLGVPTVDTGYNEVVGWTMIGIGCAFIIVVLCCCSRIRLAVAVCKCAGQFVASVCSIVFVPIFQTTLVGGMWGACLVIMVYLVSAAKFTAGTGTYFSYINDYADESLIRFYCFVFGTLWCNAFLGAMTIFIVASACCMWYYSHGPGQELSLPVWRSYKMIFRYHFGSLAFGSLILAIIQFMQLVVELFKRQVEAQGGSSKCLEYVTRCIQCCLACVECIVKFINTNAYIQIALRGKHFCAAAKDGFEIAWSNAMRYTIVGGVGTIIMFLGKLIIAAITAVGFYCLITFVSSVQQNYLKPVYQVIVVAVIGYVVALLFMSVYTIAMDTLLQCFIVDETNQKGKGKGAAVYAPADLAELMDTD